jgi:hypothetical protein
MMTEAGRDQKFQKTSKIRRKRSRFSEESKNSFLTAFLESIHIPKSIESVTVYILSILRGAAMSIRTRNENFLIEGDFNRAIVTADLKRAKNVVSRITADSFVLMTVIISSPFDQSHINRIRCWTFRIAAASIRLQILIICRRFGKIFFSMRFVKVLLHRQSCSGTSESDTEICVPAIAFDLMRIMLGKERFISCDRPNRGRQDIIGCWHEAKSAFLPPWETITDLNSAGGCECGLCVHRTIWISKIHDLKDSSCGLQMWIWHSRDVPISVSEEWTNAISHSTRRIISPSETNEPCR